MSRRKETRGRKPIGKRAMTQMERNHKFNDARREEKALIAQETEMKEYSVFKHQREARDFVSRLVEADGNLVLAVRHTFPGYKQQNVEVCYKKGKRLLERLDIATILGKAMDSMEVSVDGIVADIVKVSKEAKKDADKLRALELLGKFKKMFEIDTGQKVLNINIGEDEFRRLAERRNRYRVSDKGGFIDVRGEESDVVMREEVIDGLCYNDPEELHSELAS